MQTAEPPLETTEPVPDKLAITKDRHRDDDGRLLGVFSSMVGQNGIKPDVWYELDASGRPVKVAE